jgi:hypothetical protein
MKISVNTEVATPQAYVAINKSRLKIYNKNSDNPTYYLQKGQEFQLELFNPTTGTILAKILLNGNTISQGGLVLRPGERVFLDRYIDVAKKFLFDTYEVANTSEVKKAIEDNGDFKVEFYKEYVPNYYSGFLGFGINGSSINTYYNENSNLTNGYYSGDITLTTYNSGNPYSLPISASLNYNTTPEGPNLRRLKSKKSIETGRVEQGSTSNQKLQTVNKSWEYFPFHTVEYKMLPLSQKINTVEDINIKRYCTNCGSKLGKGHNFCANCGTKA